MTGITEAQLRVFSKRTALIEVHLARVAFAPAPKTERMHADQLASVATRRRKNPEWNYQILTERWHTEAEAAASRRQDA